MSSVLSAAPFPGFAQQWTPLLFAHELGASLLPARLAGEDLVLFRGADGAPRALLDRCPHRGVALSLGTLVDGCVECPFHGWRFDGDGRRVAVPLNRLDPA